MFHWLSKLLSYIFKRCFCSILSSIFWMPSCISFVFSWMQYRELKRWVVSSNFLSNSFTFPSALSLWFKILILIIVIFLFYFFFFTILCQKFQVFIFISLSIVTVILQSVPNNCNIRSISLLISFFWLLLLFSLCFISYRSWLSLTVFWILYLKHFLWA